MIAILLATVLLNVQRCGVDLTVESDAEGVDPARSTFVTLTLRSPRGVTATPPRLRERVRGFSEAEEFAEEPVSGKDGSVEQTVRWRLVPEPCADDYAIAPFVVETEADGKKDAFWAGPIRFAAPPPREPVTGGMEVDPAKVLPPLSWRLVGWCALGLLGVLALGAALVALVRLVARKVREHRMSPIERAWVELDRLLRRGLPGRGRYKEFYVELTMVVRRYIQRRHGIRAPNLTTEEFFAELGRSGLATPGQEAKLREFLTSADMVKFAGVQATPEMADDATASARTYLQGDARSDAERGGARA